MDTAMLCHTCGGMTPHHTDAVGRMHCVPCLTRTAAQRYAPVTPQQPVGYVVMAPQYQRQQRQGGGFVWGVIKIALFIVAIGIIGSFVISLAVCGGTCAAVSKAGQK